MFDNNNHNYHSYYKAYLNDFSFWFRTTWHANQAPYSIHLNTLMEIQAPITMQ